MRFQQRHLLDSAFHASVILPRCREYNIVQRAINASLLVPILYEHTDNKFEPEPLLQEGEDIGNEAGYKLFPILKSLSGLRKRDDEQCWAYEEQPWWSEIVNSLMLTKRRIIADYNLLASLGVLDIESGVPDKSNQGNVPPSRLSSIPMAVS